MAAGEQWKDVYDRLTELVRDHHTTLIFVNTRRASERVAFALSERLGEEHVGSHHGSLSKEKRLALERRLKAGEMEALVAASAAGLTIYDMCKAVDRGMSLEGVRLVEKRGGKSGTWTRPDEDPPQSRKLP